MKRWGNSVLSCIAMTVVAAMLAGLGLRSVVSASLSHLGVMRESATALSGRHFRHYLAGTIAASVDSLDNAPSDIRTALIAAMDRPLLKFELIDAPNFKPGTRWAPDLNYLRAEILTTMDASRPVIIADNEAPSSGKTAALQPANFKRLVWVEVALSDSHWVLITIKEVPLLTDDPVADRYQSISLAVAAILAALLGTLLSILAARRIAEPLSELSAAVESFNVNGDALPIAPRGPREVRRTIVAFLGMWGRLRRLEEGRTRMISAMYHDLRTPLTRLRLRSELVENGEQRQRMLAEIDRLNAMIDSILSFARDDANHEVRSLVDLSALVEGICEDAADLGQSVTFSGERGVTITCRPIALRRALSNLVDNAVKYGRKAEVNLVSETDWAVITVEDEGPGIPRGERAKVFEPFYRIEGSRNEETGGVGLGLSVARSIITEHGGEIELSNRREGGLNVRVEIPNHSMNHTTSLV